MQADGMTPTESIVAQIWAGTLESSEVRPESDFFRLGGDSLLLLNMLFQAGEALGVEIQPAVLLENPTLRGFCGALDLIRTAAATDLATGLIEGSV